MKRIHELEFALKEMKQKLGNFACMCPYFVYFGPDPMQSFRFKFSAFAFCPKIMISVIILLIAKDSFCKDV